MKLQVLVATMNQKDFSLFEKMNIQCDVIFANQENENRYEWIEVNGCQAIMRTTDTRGVGKNRNMAFIDADADILLLSDDDNKYFEGYSELVLSEFMKRPDADAIIFSMIFTKNGQEYSVKRNKSKRIRIYNALKHGTAALAVRREALLKHNIHFSELFGGGCIYGSGEDSIFILDLLRNGCKVYTSDVMIARNAIDSSTWFSGYDKKYFYDRGALFCCAFPKMRHLIKWYFLFRSRNLSEIPFCEMRKQMNRGIKGFDKLVKYEESISDRL